MSYLNMGTGEVFQELVKQCCESTNSMNDTPSNWNATARLLFNIVNDSVSVSLKLHHTTLPSDNPEHTINIDLNKLVNKIYTPFSNATVNEIWVHGKNVLRSYGSICNDDGQDIDERITKYEDNVLSYFVLACANTENVEYDVRCNNNKFSLTYDPVNLLNKDMLPFVVRGNCEFDIRYFQQLSLASLFRYLKEKFGEKAMPIEFIITVMNVAHYTPEEKEPEEKVTEVIPDENKQDNDVTEDKTGE